MHARMLFAVCFSSAALVAGSAAAQTEPAYGYTPLPTLPPDAVAAPDCVCPPMRAVARPPIVVAPAPSPAVAFRPLLPVAPIEPEYVAGRGILGQPKLYVPRQPVRNFIRYLSP